MRRMQKLSFKTSSSLKLARARANWLLLKTWATTPKNDLEPLSEPRVFGYAQRMKVWVKNYIELAQGHLSDMLWVPVVIPTQPALGECCWEKSRLKALHIWGFIACLYFSLKQHVKRPPALISPRRFDRAQRRHQHVPTYQISMRIRNCPALFSTRSMLIR